MVVDIGQCIQQYLVWNAYLLKLALVGEEGRHMVQLMGHPDPSDHQGKEGVQSQLSNVVDTGVALHLNQNR